jgi:hypothetical protein
MAGCKLFQEFEIPASQLQHYHVGCPARRAGGYSLLFPFARTRKSLRKAPSFIMEIDFLPNTRFMVCQLISDA